MNTGTPMILAATTLALPASLTAAELRLVEYHQRNLAYIIVPRTAKKLPALLLFHDWTGLTDTAIQQAAKIAEQGYAVFLLDLFGGKVPQSREEAGPLVEAMLATERQHELLANVCSGLQLLESFEEVEPVGVSVHGIGLGEQVADCISKSGMTPALPLLAAA